MKILRVPAYISEQYKRVRIFLFSLSMLGIYLESQAQDKNVPLANRTLTTERLARDDDSTAERTMSVQDFYDQIMRFHPVARQANLLTENARQELRIARGGFDPKIDSYWDRKEFSETTYFNRWSNTLKVPLWIGELKGGHEYAEGVYLNPELRTPDMGLTYVGLTVPLGQGLIIDARRATLRQAQLFQTIAEADRVKEINKLILSAAKDYWEWYLAYNEYVLLENAYELAEVRFNATKERVTYGEAAPIDSVEAKTILQDRRIMFQRARIYLLNTQLIVSNYLWGEENTPLELPENVLPGSFNPAYTFLDEATLQELTQRAQERHPDLIKLTFKLEQLQVEERFNRDRLKPGIFVNYNLLSGNPFAMNDVPVAAYMMNNYKIGAQLSFPLFLRKERGKLQQTRVKIAQTDLERFQTNREIMNGIQASYNELKNLEQLIVMQQDIVDNYETLRAGEIQKFEAGESSIFLINARETVLIDAQRKLLDLKSKYEKEKAFLTWVAGGIPVNESEQTN